MSSNLDLEESVDALVSQDTQINIELALVNNSVNEVISVVEELTTSLTVLEETVVELIGKLEQLEVNGKYCHHINSVQEASCNFVLAVCIILSIKSCEYVCNKTI